MKTIIRIQRTDGTIETVERPGHLTDAEFEAATKATRAAGRGELLSMRHVGSPSASKPVNIYRLVTQLDRAARARADGRCPKCYGYCSGDCQ